MTTRIRQLPEAPNFRSADTCKLCKYSAFYDCEIPRCSKWNFYFSFMSWADKVCADFKVGNEDK